MYALYIYLYCWVALVYTVLIQKNNYQHNKLFFGVFILLLTNNNKLFLYFLCRMRLCRPNFLSFKLATIINNSQLLNFLDVQKSSIQPIETFLQSKKTIQAQNCIKPTKSLQTPPLMTPPLKLDANSASVKVR